MTAPVILAIDTATESCSVALLHAGGLVVRNEVVGQKHSERVLPLVDAVLAESGISLKEVDAFAYGAGPGSFTGLRIACGVVQGLAYGARRPVVGVGSLRALAAAAFAQRAERAVVLGAIDARMHEVYCAVYRNDEEVSELRAPALESPAALAQICRDAGVDLVAGDALMVFPEAWEGGIDGLADVRGGAREIARLAQRDLALGRATPPAEAMPHYVRDRVALTVDERRARVGR